MSTLQGMTGGGSYNTAIGHGALSMGTTAHQYNVAVGYNALSNTSGNQNTGMGYYAGWSITTGANNTIAGYSVTAQSLGITTGSANTIIGANVGGLPAALSNSIILSDGDGNATVPAATTDNYLNIGNVIQGDMAVGPLNVSVPVIIQGEPNYLLAETCPDSDLSTDPVASGWTLAAGVDVWSAGQIASTPSVGMSTLTIPLNVTAGKHYLISLTRSFVGPGRSAFYEAGSGWYIEPTIPSTSPTEGAMYLASTTGAITMVSADPVVPLGIATKQYVDANAGVSPAIQDIVLYVATTGDDISGDGSVGNRFATVQHAVDIGGRYDYVGTYIRKRFFPTRTLRSSPRTRERTWNCFSLLASQRMQSSRP
jgi:hypothetical protein